MADTQHRHEHEEDLHAKIAKLSYEDARARLVDIVTRLEQGSIPLEESLRLWEIGEALGKHCQAWLDGVAQRINDAENGETSASTTNIEGNTAQNHEPTSNTAHPVSNRTTQPNDNNPAQPNDNNPAQTDHSHNQQPQPSQNTHPHKGQSSTQRSTTQEDKISALQQAVNNVRSEDIPAVTLPATHTKPANVELETSAEDNGEDFNPEDEETTALDTTPLTVHPEDFE
ncbi:exodeoxyribonuclease VII small subunit [Actinotignum urinale]|uniref:Exodeoxyribonuclease 7 small subunit n=1 Tax=Actinotignum urinale TaxID=190146 RepID=A0ABU5GBG2_9ACTO|nr:exodeoxyribonuclease VII small subunit [Actinotignum urinale]MDY5132968.1 exodeoxyribonuclease VII small subunit [Actinotignum urinale]